MATRKNYTFVQKVSRLERLKNSYNGNPRYRVHFEDGQSYITGSDHAFVYGIENSEMKGLVKVEVNKRDRIVSMIPEKKELQVTADDVRILTGIPAPLHIMHNVGIIEE